MSDDEVRNDGIFMQSIDSFSFSRDADAEIPVLQVAILNKLEAANLLTTSQNYAYTGQLVCHFSTILFANFYTSVGLVDGSGIVSIQFGSNCCCLHLGDHNLQANNSLSLELRPSLKLHLKLPASSISAMLVTGLLALSGVAVSLM
jgi:hypothetical protein